MHYCEGREHSAEILRLAVAHMGRQKAALNPCSYAVWYEHCAGLNPSLSRALETRLSADSPLTDEDVWHLYTRFIADRDSQRYERVRDELYRILQDTAVDADFAGKKASDFNRAVGAV
jgi:diguanylate cyclase